MQGRTAVERIETVIIGAGQAGLSTAYHLGLLGQRCVILESNDRVGDTWRHRWNSLRLFTPARFDGLDGMPFPAPAYSFPTKNAMADYLEAYAAKFGLAIRTNTRVERVWRENGTYMVGTGATTFEADNVVIAMANFQTPRIPEIASKLSIDIVQLHSMQYRSPAQLRKGPVLVVGAGNSGGEIALEVARAGHPTFLSGRVTGQVPFRIDGAPGRLMLMPFVLRVIFHRILTVDTPMGRKARPKILAQGTQFIRAKETEIAAAKIERVPRTLGTRNGAPVLDDDRSLDVANVIWCTGFDPGFSWIDLPVFDDAGFTKHRRGISEEQPGIFFVGQHFLYAMSSTMIHGVGRDAKRIADAIVAGSTRAAATSGARAS